MLDKQPLKIVDELAESFKIEPCDIKLLESDVDWDIISKNSNEMDKECIPLCDAMNAVKGIITSECCSGHGRDNMRIFFKSTSWKGLFFITRCIDRRYWKYGHKWTCELTVGDSWSNGILPTYFYLYSEDIGEEAYEQANDLVMNLNLHLNHKNFKKEYELTDDDFMWNKFKGEQ